LDDDNFTPHFLQVKQFVWKVFPNATREESVKFHGVFTVLPLTIPVVMGALHTGHLKASVLCALPDFMAGPALLTSFGDWSTVGSLDT
jgi:hypothetical protein